MTDSEFPAPRAEAAPAAPAAAALPTQRARGDAFAVYAECYALRLDLSETS